ncbi:DUF2639 domain-containing protein [Bacillus sp. HNG]|uniref:DUF2639 domain-containing protein n=1 Tax=Bacillaceae TaxID=186817 RepID=UPI000E2FEC70|nr:MULTISPECIES: DUF2639 domain-containing protein [Bacillaceae]MDR4889370.1 DUF2639 domain-containing protein [Fredinandcohnia sp. QZ13]RFB15141.1 DUF2639 domain-containing protein [Bacillus sp. HNG]
MAYPGSKGWYVKQLKEKGIHQHPVERKKLETYKTYILRQLYFELVVDKEAKK